MTKRATASPAEASAGRGLWRAAGLAFGIASANGFSRFAYALVLPAMRTDLDWGYTEAGALNTANALGYLAGSLLALGSIRRVGATRLFVLGLWITAVALLATGLTRDLWLLMAARSVTGVSGALVFIAGGALAAGIFPRDGDKAASAITIFFAGGGVGLVGSGLALPWLLAALGDEGWPWAWFVLGMASTLSAAVATLSAWAIREPAARSAPAPWSKGHLWPILFSYCCFAFGYIAYITFVVAWMREHGATALEVAVVWTVLGAASLVGQRLWSPVLARRPGGQPMAMVMAALTIGAGLPLLGASLPLMLASAAVYGGTLFMSPAAVTAFAKRSLPPAAWGEAVAYFTVLFACLQWLAPIATGALADWYGGLRASLAVSAAVLAIGAAVALVQREPQPPR